MRLEESGGLRSHPSSLALHPALVVPRALARLSFLVSRVSASGVVREGLGLAFLAAMVLLSFRDAIGQGLIAVEKDTLVFFYPLEAWVSSELKAGRFPLWNPYIFAGYPALADGEIGLTYPLHLALLWLLPVEQAFIWQRISNVLLAAGAMYALCRALRLGPAGAVLGGLTFSLGSFFLSQQHHENITRTAPWLPLIMACVEWGVRWSGWRRHLILTGAGVALGLAALGLHPQVLGMTLLGFSSWVAFRVLVGPSPGTTAGRDRRSAEGAPVGRWAPVRALVARCALMIWIGLYVTVLGLGLASVQLLPLVELGAATYRGTQPEYFFATSYALPIPNLVNLVFPYFFRGPESDYWSLWARWETTLYAGVAPLVLSLVGVVAAWRREAVYFALLAVGALWLAFATYAPFDLYGVLWQVPGFSAFRVPGRYTYLFLLGVSVLAALGLHALASGGQAGYRARRIVVLALLVLLAGALAALSLAVEWGHRALLADPAGATAWIERSYLALRHTPEGLLASDVYRGLVHSLNVSNPRTAFGLVLLGFAVLLVAGAVAGRRTQPAWRLGLVGLASVDLLVSGMSFHEKAPIGRMSDATPAVRFLAERLAPSGDEWRVYTPGASVPSMEFNQLVPHRIADIGGYSSAEPRANFAYWATLHSLRNGLLDIGNVRYLVRGAQLPALPSYRSVPFDPERPLLLGGRGSLGGAESYTFGGVPAHRIQVIAGLTRALAIPQGETVAELTVVPVQGEPAVVPLRAGVHVSEWAVDRADVAGRVQHARPAEVAFRRPDVSLLDGARYELLYSYAEADLPREMHVDRVEIRYVHERGGMELYGLGLYNFTTHLTVGAVQEMRSGLEPIYRDAYVQVLENHRAFPRAYVVPRSRLPPAGTPALSAMLDGAFDPAQEVMLDRPPRVPRPELPAPDLVSTPGRRGPAELLVREADRVVYRARAPQGGYFVHVAANFPGWRAWIDGQDAEVVTANSLFQAVLLPPGEHVVELRYDPATPLLGLQMTAWAASGGLAVVLGALLAAGLGRRRSVAPPDPRVHPPAVTGPAGPGSDRLDAPG